MADEVRDEARGRPPIDLVRCAELLDPTVVEDGDPIGHRHRLLLVVRHVHEGRADLAVDLGQLELEPLAKLQVEGAERLVQEKHGRALDERPRNRDPLLLPAGELRRRSVAVGLEPDQRQCLLRPPAHLRLRDPIHAQAEADVLEHAHVRKQRVRLEHGVHRSLVRRQRVDPPAVQRDRPLRRRDETADEIQRRRLAAARRAEQAEELAVADGQVELGQGEVTAVPLHDSAQLDAGEHGVGGHRLGRLRHHGHRAPLLITVRLGAPRHT